MRIRTHWTEMQELILVEKYPDTKTEEIAKLIGIPLSKVRTRATKLGLKKSAEFMRSPLSGRLEKGTTLGSNNLFKKGSTPANKGKKLHEVVKDPKAIERIKANQFKKGGQPHNTKSDGTITIRRDNKTSRPYKWIRIAQGHWEMLHCVLYKKHFGPVPNGFVISFKDGNSLNVVIDNLEIISTEENMRRNTIHNLPLDVVEVIRLTSKLTRKIKKLSHGQEQNY